MFHNLFTQTVNTIIHHNYIKLHRDLKSYGLDFLESLVFSETTYLYFRVKHLETNPCSSCLSSWFPCDKNIMNLCMQYIDNFYWRFVTLFVSQLTDSLWDRETCIIPDISKYPSLVVIIISSGEKWLTSRVIFQQSCPVRTSETPLVNCPGPFWFSAARCWPLNGGKKGDCVYPGQEKDPSLLFAQSIQSRSLGSRKGGRPKSCAKMRLGCVQFGKGSQLSRRKMGRDNILCCSPIS